MASTQIHTRRQSILRLLDRRNLGLLPQLRSLFAGARPVVAYNGGTPAGGVLTTTENVAGTRPSLLGHSIQSSMLWVVAAATAPALLYLLFVFHYSVNVPWAVDDWEIIPIVNAALHGHLGFAALWSQYGNRRLVMSRVIFVGFGLVDGLNEQTVMLFSAATFAASYALILRLFRSYLGRALTPLSVLVVGVVWFSLADFLNALWSFQLSWFLVEFFFVAMMCFLLSAPRQQRRIFLYLGIAAAVAGSLSDVQGLSLWPLGLICILWSSAPGRRMRLEIAAWVAAASITMVVYFRGFSFADPECVGPRCSLGFELHHPVLMAKYFAFLVGNVAPRYGSAVNNLGPSSLQSVGYYEWVGAAICIVAGYVVVQTVRQRRSQGGPLPLLLITFGVLFDLLITESREGRGILRLTSDQYVMPNLVLILGIVVYALAHIPDLTKRREMSKRRRWLGFLGACSLAAFLVAQFGWSTEYGIAGARVRHHSFEIDARVLANQRRIPSTLWHCYTTSAVFRWGNHERLITVARRDGLSIFHSGAELHIYEAEGPPWITPCQPLLKRTGPVS